MQDVWEVTTLQPTGLAWFRKLFSQASHGTFLGKQETILENMDTLEEEVFGGKQAPHIFRTLTAFMNFAVLHWSGFLLLEHDTQ